MLVRSVVSVNLFSTVLELFILLNKLLCITTMRIDNDERAKVHTYMHSWHIISFPFITELSTVTLQ